MRFSDRLYKLTMAVRREEPFIAFVIFCSCFLGSTLYYAATYGHATLWQAALMVIGSAAAAAIPILSFRNLENILRARERRRIDEQAKKDLGQPDPAKPVGTSAPEYETGKFEEPDPELAPPEEKREYPKVRAKMSLDYMTFTKEEVAQKLERYRDRRKKFEEGGEGQREKPKPPAE